jgi:GNAT superfamily N-acetyltransferase
VQSPNHVIDLDVQIEKTARVMQIGGMFDVPIVEKLSKRWEVNLPLHEQKWLIGLIVGSSGSGKTLIAKHLWSEQLQNKFEWNAKSIIDDFEKENSLEELVSVFSSIGFNTIPSWLKPFRVLSNGEQFRVNMARTLLKKSELVVVDEFTSVVDRQVAQITSHAIQKYIRAKKEKQFVALSCHYDIIDWLQPDWTYDVNSAEFRWRSLRRRPTLQGRIERIERDNWKIFAPYHYMSAELSKIVRCFGLFVNDVLAGFIAVLYRPISSGKDRGKVLYGISRVVILPDYQGLGLAFIFMNTIASAYKACGRRFRNFPAHPIFIRKSYADKKNWRLIKTPYTQSALAGNKRSRKTSGAYIGSSRFGAVFEYVGEPMQNEDDARHLVFD